MYKLIVYVPVQAAAALKEQLFNAGAGKIGHYERCCFETLGQGQFRPLEAAQPFVGRVNVDETVEELKIEMVVAQSIIGQVIARLKRYHPYETPAYQVIACVDF